MSLQAKLDECVRKYEYLLGLCTRQSAEVYLPLMDDKNRPRSVLSKSIRAQIDKTAGQLTGPGHMGTPVEELREYGKG